MANYERGVYEPPSDDIRVFDGGEDDIDEEGSRLPLLIVIALLVLAAFGGVVYLAYTQGVQRGRTDAPRMIAAAPGPAKTAPSSPGGAVSTYKGLKIYEQPAPNDEDASEEETAPQPPTTIQPANKSAAQPTVPVTQAPDLRPQQNGEAPVKQAVAPPPKQVAAAEPKQVVTVAPKQVVAAAPATVPEGPATAPPRKLMDKTKPVATHPAAIATPAPAASATSGSAMLQIGAYKSEAEANAAWHSYETKHPIAGGYNSDVKQVDLGEKGTWYRLRIGPFGDKAAASSFCDKLKADGANCFPAQP